MVTNRLPALAARLKLFAEDAGLAGANVRYVVRGREMVPEHDVRHLRDMISGASSVTVDLPFAARRIWMKTNLRIDGIERMPGVTAKLQLAARGVVPSVLRDLRGRAIARDLIANPKIGIPQIRSRDKKAGGWYIEDLIDGRTATPADLVDFVTRHGASVWLPAARLRQMKRPAQRGLIQALERSLAPVFPPVPEDALWPVALSHNDLMLDNLLLDSKGKFWLLDWEAASVVPLVADLGNAYLDAPELAGTILALLAAADPSGRALSPRHQLALGASLALQRRAAGRPFAAAEAKLKGIPEQDAIRQFDGRINNYRRAIVQLAA